MSAGAKLAVDIGGTFTDLVLERDGTQHQTKLLTTSAAPEGAVLEAVSYTHLTLPTIYSV